MQTTFVRKGKLDIENYARNNCFRSKHYCMTLHQEETGKLESRKKATAFEKIRK